MFHDVQRVQKLLKIPTDVEQTFLEIHERARNPDFSDSVKVRPG